ncbi:MAG: hypothetical protein OXH31_02380 [Gammaproteobacteria bacterium]|nr:hypothetical protein [Gammaproteobacteria bacterium]
MSRNLRNSRWLWGLSGGLGLGVVTLVCLVLLNANNHTQTETRSAVNEPMEPSVVASSEPTILPVDSVVEESPKLTDLEFPPGSVEEACGLSDFPSYWEDDEILDNDPPQTLESEECRTALEMHMNALNPYLWSHDKKNVASFAFVVLEEPLTFERIFADPASNLARVQDALSRSECLLQRDETNWELKDSCSADAFMNYAMFNRYCYSGGIRPSEVYVENPTLAQSVTEWKHELAMSWIEEKCDMFAPELRLTADRYPELTEWLWSLSDPEERDMMEVIYGRQSMLSANLIEYAARLGDDAAGITQVESRLHIESGAVYGRFSWLLDSEDWHEFRGKPEPSAEHFLHTFKMLAMVGARRPDPRDEIKFDWEWVASHLCEPPYSPDIHYEDEEIPELKSCQEVIHELRQRNDLKFSPLFQTLDKLEQVALELGVYE